MVVVEVESLHAFGVFYEVIEASFMGGELKLNGVSKK